MISAARAARRSPASRNGVSRALSPAAAASSAATRGITSSHPSPGRWRNSRMVGYHGLSSRSSSQRQSFTQGSSTHVGLPSAPARCATAVSTVMTRSSASTAPAVSAKSASSGARSITFSAGCCATSAACGPTCRLANETPGTRNERRQRGEIERAAVVVGMLGMARPDQPDLDAAHAAQPLAPARRHLGRRAQISHRRRDRLEASAEQARQAQQCAFDIGRRGRAAVTEKLDADEVGAHQCQQRLVHAEADRRRHALLSIGR